MQQRPAERLREYRRKRDFRRTLEPVGADKALDAGCLYVMHKHAASHDHFDLRIEQDGVLRSWALPKGPSLEPGEKRLAVETEDHPLEYGGFEGVIPAEEYGGGTIMLWDAGSWRLNGRNDDDQVDFVLDGEKLKGAWTLVRTRGRGKDGKPGRNWLLIKRSDRRRRRLAPADGSVASGRSMEEIARDRDNAWIAGGMRALSPRAEPPVAGDIPGARKREAPATVEPQLATLADEAPAGEDWLHEIKLDGYRLLARVDHGQVRLLSRNGHDWTARFPEQAETIGQLPADSAIMDGEMVVMRADGSTSFRDLQEALSAKRTTRLVFHAFDLLYLDGHDLRGARLTDRKQALRALLAAAGCDGATRLRYSDHIAGNGPAFFQQACTLGLEGIIAKRADAGYAAGRNRNWLKVKCTEHAEFVVGAYTQPAGSRRGFGSLLLGAYAGADFVYAGRVGTGFNARQLKDIHAALAELETGSSPFTRGEPETAGAHWVKPELVVEVEFTERTRDGRLRHPVFRGVREDREAKGIALAGALERTSTGDNEPRKVRRAAGDVTVAGVRLTHADRVMYPKQGLTKLDLARYYLDIADWALPWLANRPLTLVRCPEGRDKACFFQKHLAQSLAKQVPRVGFRQSRGIQQYAYVKRISDVIALVQAGVLEFHPFGCQVGDLEHPDMMVFDLDPSPGVAWTRVLEATRTLHARLDALGLPCFLRATGGKGLHIVVPLKPKADWEQVKNFARAVSELQANDDPGQFTAKLSKSKRRGRIFIDYLRNTRGATAIACYSARAREGAPVSVPLRWDELGKGLRPDRYKVNNLRRRLGALKADPWADFYAFAVPLEARLMRAVGLQ